MTRDEKRRQRFDALFARHRLDIASYCSWRTDSVADAEDAVAEVFLVAWRKIDSIPHDDGARAWLYATARRVTANARRSRRRHEALTDRMIQQPHRDEPGPDVDRPEEALVHEALSMLDDDDREVLLLVEWEGLRPRELAEVLGCMDVTARGRLHRARARFRLAFESLRDRQSVVRQPAFGPISPLTSEMRKAQS
jgi:RNA polymerase sigma-70 factor (ECF subfamily)